LLLLFSLRAMAQAPVLALVAEFDRIGAGPLWPGFDPRKTPVAIYDGTNTYLHRHPAPPQGFAPLEGHPGFYVFAGRHPSVRANSSADIGGVTTATLLLGSGGRDRAAVLVHECFHVFQRQRYPGWSANEAVLFTYPVEDAENLALARLELQALGRALAGDRACWAGRAISLRRERFARLPGDAVAYERGTELNEGLAQYVEGIAEGRKDVRFRDFGPAEVRPRGYVSGEALAKLLDQLAPDWKSRVSRSLDELLPDTAADCDFTDEERQAARRQAEAGVEALKRQRAELLAMFQTQPGWRLTVEAADGKPLLLKSFDPMNVERLTQRAILHKRMLQLGNDAGTLEIMNHGSVTTAAGGHPLFDGVRQWTTTGLAVKPEIGREGDKLVITASGIRVSFSGAQVESQAEAVVVHLR
jgi:hypothetical protein